ncbi:MAG TPA: glycosyltransferase, partial [Fibrella sp.]
GFEKRVHYRSITDLSLYELYHQAEAFVFPSLNEGFGIPVLEAFSAGCPAILSNRSSLPEVGADAAIYFDPEQDESIAYAVEKVLTDTALQKEMRNKGSQRLKQFSWEKTAAKTYSLYRQLS